MPPDIVFVLVRPAVPENVGAAARALKTMGFARLRIVASSVHRAHQARILAHGAGEVLDGAESYGDLPAALADIDFAVGTSAKARHDKRYLLGPRALRQAIAGKRDVIARAAVVFGSEESGLTNEELRCCHALASIPLATAYPSLNLGQAVMLFAYELSGLSGRLPEPTVGAARRAPAQGEWQALRTRLQRLLEEVGAPDDGVLARWLAERSAVLSSEDVRLAHLLCHMVEQRCAAVAVPHPSDDKADAP